MSYEQKPGSNEYAEYYGRYIARVPEGDIIAILATQIPDTIAMLRELGEEQALRAYAPGKWTIKEVIGHMCDAERIFSYRALRFARNDATELPGFDENEYVPQAGSNQRPLASLLAEFAAVRSATVALFAGLPADAWTRTGSANGQAVSVRAIANILAGHELHHRAIITERYLGLPAS
jgi:uncharacterized damage-inducible protein DinB